MTQQTRAQAAVIDANIVISLISKEAGTHTAVEQQIDQYLKTGVILAAPNVLIAEVVFALCQKVDRGILCNSKHDAAIDAFLDLLTQISLCNDESRLLKRAVEIRSSYGCSRSSDSLYLALAEELSNSGLTTELYTLDRGISNQAAKNAPKVTVRTV